jgi:hypothetical protein
LTDGSEHFLYLRTSKALFPNSWEAMRLKKQNAWPRFPAIAIGHLYPVDKSIMPCRFLLQPGI